jgi:hypothetical protein
LKNNQKLHKKQVFFKWMYGVTLKLKQTEIIPYMWGAFPSLKSCSLRLSLTFGPISNKKWGWNRNEMGMEKRDEIGRKNGNKNSWNTVGA